MAVLSPAGRTHRESYQSGENSIGRMREPSVAKLISLPRWIKRVIVALTDYVLLLAALWLAYALRYGQWYVPSQAQLLLMLAAPAIAIPVFEAFGIYRVVVRFVTEKTMWTIIQAMIVAALLWLAFVFMTEFRGVQQVPRSVPAIYAVIGIVLISASRMAARRLLGAEADRRSNRVRTLIYGAGPMGRQLAAALRADGGSHALAFVDSDPALIGAEVAGLKIHSTERLARLVDSLSVQQVIICGDTVDATTKTKLFGELAKKNIRMRFLPAVSRGFGDNLVDSIREMGIDDLLGRPVVAPDAELLRAPVRGQTVLVTGAGGSIGAELCSQIMRLGPRKLVLAEMNEFALYEIDRRLAAGNGVEIVSLLGSVADRTFVDGIFREHAIDTVFHAAAYKHVPLIEANPLIGITNNVIGTWIVAEAAKKAGVERFVLISTDKAVRPTSVMGASKRWSELIVRCFDGGASRAGRRQHFCAVRFGNVIGSQGSVVPLFREQIEQGGPITLTHEEMTRYFMSVSEASELIIQAASLSENGEVFLLDMGQPVKIRELAENMIRLSGRSIRNADNPEGDVEIMVTGVRPGEKLFEELVFDDSEVAPTRNPKILRTKHTPVDFNAIRAAMETLGLLVLEGKIDEARRVLFDFTADHG
jgi:FlaA1/EpsC-like NDP-sugar epimerase